jgi:glucokinase
LPETLEAEEISRRAMESRCPVCAEALDMMMAFLGNVSGNLALTLNAFGGVYLAGGICLQLGEGFMNSRFRAVFEAKGRYEDYLRQVPTYLIRHPYIAFVGLGGVIRANS